VTCLYYRPNQNMEAQSGAGRLAGTTDVCLLLLPSGEGHEERRQALHALGHELAPVPFGCPFVDSEHWRDCPYFREAGSIDSGH
jgi:hypothetical protein